MQSTTNELDLGILQVGDCLLYKPSSLMGYAIAIKSWTWISHVEVYLGAQTSFTSRDGIGVGVYPIRTAGLACVRRPFGMPPCYSQGSKWIPTVVGQKYDWKGLLCFTLAVHQGATDRMFCSEAATNYYRTCGFEPFNEDVSADHVAPSEFYQSGMFRTVWKQV